MALPSYGRISQEQRTAYIDSLQRELPKAKTASDSLPILYDLYDLSNRPRQKAMAWEIYHVAERAGDNEAIMDMLRQLSDFNLRSDSVLKFLISRNARLPESETQKGTALFLAVKRAAHDVAFSSEADRQKKLTQMLARRDGKKDDIFSDIEELYTLAIYLGSSSKGGMYKEYVKKLSEEINQLPPKALAIRNLFWTTSAIFYSKNLDYEQSLNADRELLKNLAELENRYTDKGRRFRNYDMVRYTSYRRMMGNYKALTLSEVDSLNNLALSLTRQNHDVLMEHESNPRGRVYWLMAHKEYAQAIPLIKKFLSSEIDDNNNNFRLQMLKMLKEAAIATGDDATLLMALKEYNEQLEEYLRLNAEGTYRELQIRYDVNELKARNHQMEIQSRDFRLQTERRIILVSVVAACILLFVVILLHRKFSNMQLRCRDLEEQIEELDIQNKSLKDLKKKKN